MEEYKQMNADLLSQKAEGSEHLVFTEAERKELFMHLAAFL
ncbi:hypothetical protein [Bacillus sp. V2I10]|nr:hypothetical protein [Bacillus sp. V2I10]MDQ0857407.1 hypothetical protein [Bacillus sp. V2I10]